MIVFAPYPIPVIVEETKEAYLLYVQSGEQFENDIWTCVLCEGGLVRHYSTDQVLIHKNATIGITPKIN